MVRTLIIIIVSGLILSVACFAGAFGLGGRELIQSGEPFRSWFGDDWGDDGDWDSGPRDGQPGPTVTRDIAWTDTDSLEIGLPADVVFTQGPAPRLTVTGPQEAVNRVVMEDGRLRYRGGRRGWFGQDGWSFGRIKVIAAAPDTKTFSLYGSPDLTINGFDQDRLELEIHGSGDVVASGRASRLDIDVSGSGVVDSAGLIAQEASVDMKGSGKVKITPQAKAEVSIKGSGDVVGTGKADKVEIEIKGSGDADLGQVDAKDADVEIMGSGKAKIAPTGVADIAIFGSGDVTLAARPATLRSKTAGSGRIQQLAPEAPPPPPAPPAAPAAPARVPG